VREPAAGAGFDAMSGVADLVRMAERLALLSPESAPGWRPAGRAGPSV
jgi:hypothetical protein